MATRLFRVMLKGDLGYGRAHGEYLTEARSASAAVRQYEWLFNRFTEKELEELIAVSYDGQFENARLRRKKK